MTAALSLLLGPDAPALMQVVLDDHGARLRALRATTVNVRPDGSATVQYAADIDRDGCVLRDVLAATTGGRIPPGAAVLAGHVDGAEAGSVCGGGRTTRRCPRWPRRSIPPGSVTCSGGTSQRCASAPTARAAAPCWR